MKTFLEFINEGVLDSIGTAANQVLNPVRRALGVQTGELPAGKKEVDYGAIAKSAVNAIDTAMSGFGGADPGKKGVNKPAPVSTKIQDRVPQEIPRSPIDAAPKPQTGSVALQRQKVGDKAPARPSMEDRLAMMRLKGDVQYNNFVKKQEADFQAALAKKKSVPVVTPDKPLVSKDNAVKKALAAKGYDETGKKIMKPAGQTTVATRPETPKPLVKNTQAAAPIPKARPAGLGTKQTFDKAFAAARSSGKKSFEFNGKIYNTRLKKR